MSNRAISRLHRRVEPVNLAQLELLVPRLRPVFRNADITEEHVAALMVWMTAGPVTIAIGWMLYGGWWALALAGGVVVLPPGLLLRWSGRRTRRLVAALPEAIDMIGRSLRSGASFSQALTEAATDAHGAVAEELRIVRDAIDRGQPAAQALGEWAVRTPEPEVRIVTAALALASENEAATTVALSGVSQSLRDRAALTGEVAALIAQASASTRALVLLPVGFLALDVASEQRTVRYLLTEPFGRLCLVAGVGLNLLGAIWMRLIVRRGLST